MAMQGMHPTVGMNGQQSGFPPEGQPLSQAGIGMPQFYGPTPVNGQQMAMPPQQMQFVPQGQQPQYQQPQFQPHPTVPFGQLPPQAPSMQQQGQQQLPPQGQRLAITGHEIMDGPGVPLELRGRTTAQVMQLYSGLVDEALRNRRGGIQQQPVGQQGQQPQMQPQQQPAQQPMQPQGQRPPTFWQNPDAAVGAQVQQAVQQALQPMQEYTLRQAAQAAQQQVFSQTPDFAQLQGELLPILREASPEHLARPEFLEGAVDLARGRAARRQMQPQQQGQQWQGQPQQQPQRFVPAGQHFPQPTYQFFTEGPTPPMGLQQGGQGTLSPAEMAAAQGFGMSPEQYAAWRAPQPTQRRSW